MATLHTTVERTMASEKSERIPDTPGMWIARLAILPVVLLVLALSPLSLIAIVYEKVRGR